ncbi:MAG: chemotaxis protein CheX [Candidatus Delongbacteria bacterium]|nr:chemotaxis protein CheX [Candidatus Delongbacteria bacterium]MBN2833393.1 chemotaxis protein CheX [Candidatus Delongbacteria bacterium]
MKYELIETLMKIYSVSDILIYLDSNLKQVYNNNSIEYFADQKSFFSREMRNFLKVTEVIDYKVLSYLKNSDNYIYCDTAYYMLNRKNNLILKTDILDEDLISITGFISLRISQILHYDYITEENLKLRTTNENLHQKNIKLEKDYNNRTHKMIYLLNHLEEGFLTFGEDLIVEDESSFECMNIFNTFVGKKLFPEIIYPDDPDQQEFLTNLLNAIFKENDLKKREVYSSLLPKEINYNEKHLKIEFKKIMEFTSISKEKFMVIISDQTKQKTLEIEMEKERNILNMVIKSVVDYNDLMYMIRQYENFCGDYIYNLKDSTKIFDRVYSEVMRRIHTFKGNFSQLGMVNLAPNLHKAEEKIGLAFEKGEFHDNASFSKFLNEIPFTSWLNQDMSILYGILSVSFFSQDSKLILYKDRLEQLITNVKTILPQFESKLIEAEIKKLARKPFRRMILPLVEYTEKLAENYGKNLDEVFIEGGDFFVEIEKFSGFCKSLIHIVRNAVIHGIEEPEERAESSKPEAGNISILIEKKADEIIVEISDDGRGLNIDIIKETAIKNKIINSHELNRMNDVEILNLIFTDGFSTSEDIDEVSGRGVGMGAVIDELNKLGGNVKIESIVGSGTKFFFSIPDIEENLLDKEIKIENLIKPISETLEIYLKENLSIEVMETTGFSLSEDQEVTIKKFGSILRLSGIVQGVFVITGDEELIRDMAGKFLNDGEPIGDSEIVMVLAEQLNIVIGNSIKKFEDIEDLVDIDSPFTLRSGETTIKYLDSNIWKCDINTGKGRLSVSFVTSSGVEMTEKNLEA